MAKKIRFPLEMQNGIEVRDLEELKENFSLERILFYLTDGKLETWLRDRYEDGLADAVSGLDRADNEFNRKICEIFEVEYVPEEEADLERIEERKRKLELLKEYTEDERYEKVIDQTAFDQDELYDLLDEDQTEIYLCGEQFSIPLGKEGIHYIGINIPVVIISSKEKIDFEGKGIVFENIRFDEKYQKVLGEKDKQGEKPQRENGPSSSQYGSYYPDSYIKFMLLPKDRKEVEKCYEKISVMLEGVGYDRDKDIRELREKFLDSGIAGMAKEYLQTL